MSQNLFAFASPGLGRSRRTFVLAGACAFLLLAGNVTRAANPYQIMPVGDSITVGYEDNPTWSLPYSFGYRSDLYTDLTNDKNAGTGISFNYVGTSEEPFNGASGTVQSTSTSVANLTSLNQDHQEGYSGVGTAFTLNHIQNEITTNKPDIILLMVGINDISAGSTANPTAAEANLNSIFTTVFTARPSAYLIVAQITPYTTTTPAIISYNNYIQSTVATYAAAGDHISTVNQYANFVNADGSTNASLYANGINHPNDAGYSLMATTWDNGIKALNLPISGPASAPAVAPVNMITNPRFDDHAGAGNSHNVNPAGQSWTFTNGVTGAGSGIDAGPTGPYANNFASYDGQQMAFIQGSGNGSVTTMSQTITGFTKGQTYTLSFESKAIGGFNGADPFKVEMIDGGNTTPLFGGASIVPSVAGYTQYSTTFVAADASPETLEFFDAGLNTVAQVSWVDTVSLTATPEPGTLGIFMLAGAAALGRRRRVVAGKK